MKEFLKKIIPPPLLDNYHFTVATLGAFLYRNPSKKLFVIAVTGTKGKSTTVELIRTILRDAGFKLAVASTIRFSIGEENYRTALYRFFGPIEKQARQVKESRLAEVRAAGGFKAEVSQTISSPFLFR